MANEWTPYHNEWSKEKHVENIKLKQKKLKIV